VPPRSGKRGEEFGEGLTVRHEFARWFAVGRSVPNVQKLRDMNGTARTLVIALATSVALSSSGCASRMANAGVIIAGGMLVIRGAVASSRDSSLNSSNVDSGYSQEISVAVVLLGVGLMAAGAIGLMRNPGDATDAISESDRLGIRAAHAAQAGDCATVRLDVTTMDAMDPQYASALVDHDPLIRACMDG
jgi:hypothetical protein